MSVILGIDAKKAFVRAASAKTSVLVMAMATVILDLNVSKALPIKELAQNATARTNQDVIAHKTKIVVASWNASTNGVKKSMPTRKYRTIQNAIQLASMI